MAEHVKTNASFVVEITDARGRNTAQEGFVVEVLNGRGPRGPEGNGISSITYDPETYIITITDSDGNVYTTEPLKGDKGDTGNGISSVVLNNDYTLTVSFTDSDPVTLGPIRGAKGNGISNITFNRNDYTMTVTCDDGDTYTTGSLRGATGNGIDDIVYDSENNTLTIYDTDGHAYVTGSLKGATGKGLSGVTMNPDHTLTFNYDDGTFTKTSYNVMGERGNGIEDVTYDNSNYTVTFHDTDGNSYTTGSLRGATGNGIANVKYNTSENTVTFTDTNGNKYTTGSLKGAKGDVGNGIYTIRSNNDGTLSIIMTNGTSYRTGPIKGDSPVKGVDYWTDSDKGEIVTEVANEIGHIRYHICSSEEYGLVSRVPVIENPDADTFYLVPAENAASPDLFVEWIYVNNNWELFGSASIDLSGFLTDVQVNGASVVNNGVASVVVPSEIDDTAGAGDTDKTWSADKITDELAGAGTVQDVQVNGTSVVSDGVAKIPSASDTKSGAVRVLNNYPRYGIAIVTTGTDAGVIKLVDTTDAQIKAGAYNYPIITSKNHVATFYGLAKAAGDTTQSSSSNTVGNYTDNAKSAIKSMLGIGGETQTVSVSGTTPSITANSNTRYICGEVATLDFTPSASGICDVIFTSGSTATVLTLPNTVILPSWFDATALEANTTYEISISDGIYGAVMIW